ncbi:hypothetical protein Vadar_026556 [Vaccinium darrowii]|uniref:Uncharacterized protein n=1 Tax=Vaccinium darrowii TaxID=229202 RepID=A0ACB7YYN3_9ERIC|nr:hypothetical protein Vadar_026556 [Vaccinium darrowii]
MSKGSNWPNNKLRRQLFVELRICGSTPNGARVSPLLSPPMACKARKEIRHDGKYVVDITEIPTKKMVQSTNKWWKQKRRDGVSQDGGGTSRTGSRVSVTKQTVQPRTKKTWKPKRRDGVSQDGGGMSRIGSRGSKISEIDSEGVVPWTESRKKENPEQTARRNKVQLEEELSKCLAWELSQLLYPQDLPDYSLYSSLKDGIDGERRVLVVAKGATFLAHKSLSTMYWDSHEEGFTERPDVLKRVKQDLLRTLTKIVLAIYDLEDFYRIVFKEDIMAERMKFLHDVDQTSSKTTTEAILDIAKGKTNFGKYTRLLERDVGNILELWERYSESSGHWNLEDYVTDDYTWSFEDVNIPETLLDGTIAVMKKMSPLKRNCAIHLLTELVHYNCTCISDTLFLEFWRDIDVSRLEVFTLVSPNRLKWLLCDILDTMNFLIEWRILELCNSICSAIFPLLFGAFGDWAQEVIDVVEHADCERRWEGDNFIRNRHLLLGLLSSRISESVQEFGRFRDDRKESSMRHVYEIYMVTEDVARMFGVNEIKLEHLFLAILVVNLGFNQRPQWIEDLQRTRNGHTVEEYIPLVQECMFKGFGIDFGNLDTKSFVGNGIANEREKWDASIAKNMVKVFYDEREKIKGSGHPRWSVGCPLWDSVRQITQLCKSHRPPMIWENGGEEDSELDLEGNSLAGVVFVESPKGLVEEVHIEGSSFPSRVYCTVMAVAMYQVWRAQNLCIFQSTIQSKEVLYGKIVQEVRSCLLAKDTQVCCKSQVD